MLSSYLKTHRMLLLFALLLAILFSAFWGLRTHAMEDSLYCLLILGTVLLTLLAIGYPGYRRQVQALQLLRNTLQTFEEAIPPGQTTPEQLYVEIAAGYQKRIRTEEARIRSHHNNANRYYTLWIHQMKTPLAALRLQLDSGDVSRAELQRELFEIERYAEMALQYVRSGNLSADMLIERQPLLPLVRESIRKYAPLFIGKRLSVEVAELQQAAFTDAKWACFVFEQLLSNAAKYTKAGGVRIYEEDGTLVFADTGAGIRAEDLPRVFEQGYTGLHGRLDKRASGIGLSLAKRVCDALGIAIRLESTVGQGTRAILRFPANPPAFD